MSAIRMDGPVLAFGGTYGNLEATRALLAAAAGLGIPPRQMICTGDVVAYCADPQAVVDLMRETGIAAVLGNCEEALAVGATDCGCGFAPGSACERLSADWYAHAAGAIDSDARAWMASLPRRLEIELAGRRLAVVHGAPSAINRFLFASTHPGIKLAEIEATRCDGVIAGHCGLPFSQVIGNRLWHNSGAAGLPANDGTPRVWYSLLVPESDGALRIEHHALAYAHEEAAAKMRAAGLPAGYADALETGIWPSLDVLPPPERAQRGVPLEPGTLAWASDGKRARRTDRRAVVARWPDRDGGGLPPLDPAKFRSRDRTAKGEKRATVALAALRTLWFNTGTLCNIECRNCYIESSPHNDRLAYLTTGEVERFLDEIAQNALPTEEIGFTGGEPFMNPEIVAMLELVLRRGFRALVLTNAMRPMRRFEKGLLALRAEYGERLTLRVSVDHHLPALHEDERGPDSFAPTLDGLLWLARNGFRVAVAGRTMWGDDAAAERAGFARLFAENGIAIDAADPRQLVLFPEMDARADVPEITEACWGILHVEPQAMMCASSRMVVRRKGSAAASVVACTLLPYDPRFELGATLAEASVPVPLNHPHCARFCVLGGASCSPG